jgi:hypothetical protein
VPAAVKMKRMARIGSTGQDYRLYTWGCPVERMARMGSRSGLEAALCLQLSR